MKLSIIIPYYNAAKYIFDMLNSLQKQGLSTSEYEVLIVDDSSTDSTSEIRRYCDAHFNVHFLSVAHGGAAKARNHGIRKARGEYLCFCDADDLVMENSLGDVYDDAHQRGLDLLFYNRFIAYDSSTPPPPCPFARGVQGRRDSDGEGILWQPSENFHRSVALSYTRGICERT